MSSSFFFSQVERSENNSEFIDGLERYSNENMRQVYVIDKPLGDGREGYDYGGALVVLSPGHKICFIDFMGGGEDFNEFCLDFIEDIGAISDKFKFKGIIGRPRKWRDEMVLSFCLKNKGINIDEMFSDSRIDNYDIARRSELVISLLTGSINNPERVGDGVPDNILDRVKKKIVLFDGEQTRFIYDAPSKKRVSIQGLSGTGKTELLLHKLKETYVDNGDARIAFTCHNKILAENMRSRIPDFFNFMRVDEQIVWEERLWCVNAWGSGYNRNSGVYAKITSHYSIPFIPYSWRASFDDVCKIALSQIREIKEEEFTFCFDYLFVDESQDFPSSFFDLCELVTRHNVYVAGDVFQSIFDEDIVAERNPDYSLSKCYRTDPRTLMFGHALGMGLFERQKLRWLSDEEWSACGYLIDKRFDFDQNRSIYNLTREPLRRFEDVQQDGYKSVDIVEIENEDVASTILGIIRLIIEGNPTVCPDDIGVIFVDNSRDIYEVADKLEVSVPEEFGWSVNKAYETKVKQADALFISNKNNVKGLEFPFVICVARKIVRSLGYRNSLYMMLTRSFLKTYFLTSGVENNALLPCVEGGLNEINSDGMISVVEPTEEEKAAIRRNLRVVAMKQSREQMLDEIFRVIGVKSKYRKKLAEVVENIVGDSLEREEVEEVARFSYERMIGSKR